MKKWMFFAVLSLLYLGMAGGRSVDNLALFPSLSDQDTVPQRSGIVPAEAASAERASDQYVYGGSVIDNPPTGPAFLNIFEMIRGRVPGLWVSGQFFNYQIRIRAALGPPLVVVNGMPYYGYDDRQISELLMIIPPMDVDYIQVIKNPGQASMYGPGAGNGVILIHTKRGAFK
jgi:outer membrane receptor protein involved in Fe transport